MFSDIPVLDVGPDFPLETLLADKPRVAALLDGATAGYPASALRLADRLSRRWLERTDNLHLPEIDAIARHIGRPGAYFLSVNYEWGCTTAVRPGFVRSITSSMAAMTRAPTSPRPSPSPPGRTGSPANHAR